MKKTYTNKENIKKVESEMISSKKGIDDISITDLQENGANLDNISKSSYYNVFSKTRRNRFLYTIELLKYIKKSYDKDESIEDMLESKKIKDLISEYRIQERRFYSNNGPFNTYDMYIYSIKDNSSVDLLTVLKCNYTYEQCMHVIFAKETMLLKKESVLLNNVPEFIRSLFIAHVSYAYPDKIRELFLTLYNIRYMIINNNIYRSSSYSLKAIFKDISDNQEYIHKESREEYRTLTLGTTDDYGNAILAGYDFINALPADEKKDIFDKKDLLYAMLVNYYTLIKTKKPYSFAIYNAVKKIFPDFNKYVVLYDSANISTCLHGLDIFDKIESDNDFREVIFSFGAEDNSISRVAITAMANADRKRTIRIAANFLIDNYSHKKIGKGFTRAYSNIATWCLRDGDNELAFMLPENMQALILLKEFEK